MLLFVSIFAILTSCGTTPVSIQPISKVIEVQGSKDNLFVKANNWMVQNFNDAKSVIQYSDKEAGIVNGKYLLKVIYDMNGRSYNVYANIKIQIKENKSKITITPEQYKYYNGSFEKQKLKESEAKQKINSLIASYESFIQTDSDNF